MKRTLEKGAGNLEIVLIMAFLIFVIFVTPQDGPTASDPNEGNWILGGPNSGERINDSKSVTSTDYRVSLSSGNAAHSYQSYEEYIVISNNSSDPVDITGWQLKNGKDQRVYNLGSGLQRFSADIAVIPQATRLLSPTGSSRLENVVLKSGERAVVTTGSVGSKYPYAISSFKENICTGYLENLSNYSFNPSLQTSCPRPELEPGLTNLDTECRTFVKRLSSCETPEFETKDREGNSCSNCIEGQRISSSCANFIREHFSYQGCIAYHAGDANFDTGRSWRIYLGRGWEMWAKDYEAIELFDRFGNLVKSVNY